MLKVPVCERDKVRRHRGCRLKLGDLPLLVLWRRHDFFKISRGVDTRIERLFQEGGHIAETHGVSARDQCDGEASLQKRFVPARKCTSSSGRLSDNRSVRVSNGDCLNFRKTAPRIGWEHNTWSCHRHHRKTCSTPSSHQWSLQRTRSWARLSIQLVNSWKAGR